MGVEKKICETCAHYHECGTRLVIHVMDNDIKCIAYREKATLPNINAVQASGDEGGTDMSELKPCPFCGVKVSLTYHSADNTFNFWHKGVNSCAACDPIKFDGEMVKSLKGAADAWNRRAI